MKNLQIITNILLIWFSLIHYKLYILIFFLFYKGMVYNNTSIFISLLELYFKLELKNLE